MLARLLRDWLRVSSASIINSSLLVTEFPASRRSLFIARSSIGIDDSAIRSCALVARLFTF